MSKKSLWPRWRPGFPLRYRRAGSFAAAFHLNNSRAMACPRFLVAMVAILVPFCVFLLVTGIRAAVPNLILVNTTSDTPAPGFCTLREAIANANAESDVSGGDCTAGAGNNIIQFSVSGTIHIGANGTLAIVNTGNTLTIEGSKQSITLSGDNLDNVFFVLGGSLALGNLTISGGSAAGGNGGAIVNDGTLLAVNCTFSNNGAAFGGGIENGDTLVVNNCTFSQNNATSEGGGIYNGFIATVTNTTFSGNTSSGGSFGGQGGGIYNNGGATLTVTNSTFSGNSTSGTSFGGQGGGILTGGTAIVTNSTFAGNSASTNGGGIFTSGTTTVTNSTQSGGAKAAHSEWYDGRRDDPSTTESAEGRRLFRSGSSPWSAANNADAR